MLTRYHCELCESKIYWNIMFLIIEVSLTLVVLVFLSYFSINPCTKLPSLSSASESSNFGWNRANDFCLSLLILLPLNFCVVNTHMYIIWKLHFSKLCQLNLPFKSGELELLNTVKQEALQVCLADASYWVDVSTGAVILCEISCQTEQEKLLKLRKIRLQYNYFQ